MKLLLTIPEAAEALGLSEATLRDWRVDRRNLAFVKVGDSLRVELSEIERFIAANRQPPVADNVAGAAHGEVRSRGRRSAKTLEFPA